MKRIVSIVLGLVLFVNTCFGYTFTLRYGDFVLTRQGIVEGTSIIFGNNFPINWNIISGGITPTAISLLEGNFVMPNQDVEIEVTDKSASEIIQVGDTINMVHSNPTYTASTSGFTGTLSVPATWVVTQKTASNITILPSVKLGNIRASGTNAYVNASTFFTSVKNWITNSNTNVTANIPSVVLSQYYATEIQYYTGTTKVSECSCGSETIEYKIGYRTTSDTTTLYNYLRYCNCSTTGIVTTNCTYGILYQLTIPYNEISMSMNGENVVYTVNL